MGGWGRDTLSVSVADGRVLEVVLAGPEDGRPLLHHHGTPGAAHIFEPLVEAGAERGLRHVAYSRPGYGDSERHPGRSVADCVTDVVAIADALGYERFYSVGGSGGGPHSIACAALVPERLIAAASIASPAPADADGLDWTAGMGQENVDEFAAAWGPDEGLEKFLEHQAASLVGVSGDQIVAALGELVSEVDRRALSGALGESMARQVNRGSTCGRTLTCAPTTAIYRSS